MTFARDRIGELAWQRHLQPLSEEDCIVWFGVGRATIERVEAGEIEPSDELEQRIDRYLQVCGGGAPSAALPERRISHSGAPSCGGAAVTGSAAFSGNAK